MPRPPSKCVLLLLFSAGPPELPPSPQLKLPRIPVLPISSDVPYTITVTTVSAPLARSKSPPADKPVFPPVPLTPDGLEFKLHRRLRVRAKIMRTNTGTTVATFLGKDNDKDKGAARPPIDAEVSPREWIPEDATPLVSDEKGKENPQRRAQDGSFGGAHGEERGTWVQRATFGSRFRLDCPPSFAVHNLECAVSVRMGRAFVFRWLTGVNSMISS